MLIYTTHALYVLSIRRSYKPYHPLDLRCYLCHLVGIWSDLSDCLVLWWPHCTIYRTLTLIEPRSGVCWVYSVPFLDLSLYFPRPCINNVCTAIGKLWEIYGNAMDAEVLVKYQWIFSGEQGDIFIHNFHRHLLSTCQTLGSTRIVIYPQRNGEIDARDT